MASTTKQQLGAALKEMMAVKPIERITIKDITEICGVNRQTFYYHFDDVYDLLEWVFEEDASRVLPREVVYDHWRDDVMVFFEYLYENRSFALNVYNSHSRIYMLRFYRNALEVCIRSFADIVAKNMAIERSDFEFVIEFYVDGIVGLITMWLDNNMQLPPTITKERFIRMLDNSVENMLARFKANPDVPTVR